MKTTIHDNTQFRDWFARNRSKLTRSGIWLDGGEPGRVDPAGFEAASVRILICRLSSYDDVKASITHKMLYWAANQASGVYVDLAFLPSAHDASLMKADGIPWWLASGCKMPPCIFDVVAISISVQQEALNLPAALKYSGLKLGHVERMSDPSHPLIVIGGNAAGSVPFIHGNVTAGREDGGLVDVVCVEDGISWLQEFLTSFGEAKRKAVAKSVFLGNLAKTVPGTYVPSLYTHRIDNGKLIISAEHGVPFPVVHRRDDARIWTRGYDGAFIPFADEDAEETLPLSFGCPYRCRFCQTGWIRGSHDTVTQSELCLSAARIKGAMAASDLNLLSSDACSVDGVEKTISELLGVFPHVSIKSLSVAGLSKSGDVGKLLRLMEKREFTLGVEGISSRLRAYLGKNASESSLIGLVKELASSGLRQLKLFFILTGLEEDDDVTEFESLLKNARGAAAQCRLIASFTPLFNAPFTPLQFSPLRRINTVICGEIEKAAKYGGAQLRWSSSISEIRLMNLFCRAGRAATATLARMSLEKGFSYHDQIAVHASAEGENMLMQAIENKTGIEGGLKLEDVLPWDDIEGGAERKQLWGSHRKAAEDFKAHTVVTESPEHRIVAAKTGKGPVAQQSVMSITHVFWVWLTSDDAHRPACTVARGLLRNLFQTWKGGGRLYLGNPALVRIEGPSGLALLSADFQEQDGVSVCALKAETPSDGAILESVDIKKLNPSTFLYLVEIKGTADRRQSRLFEVILKSAGIKFQFIRKNGVGWYLVGETYRRRHGLLAIEEKQDGSIHLICAAKFLDSMGKHRDVMRGGIIRGVYGEAQEKCPACGAKLIQPVKIMPGIDLPVCIDCFARTGPEDE